MDLINRFSFLRHSGGIHRHIRRFKYKRYSEKMIINEKKWCLLRLHGVTFTDASSRWLLTLAYGLIQALICISNSCPHRIRNLRKTTKLFYLRRMTASQVKQRETPFVFLEFIHFCGSFWASLPPPGACPHPPLCRVPWLIHCLAVVSEITVYTRKGSNSVVSKK